MLFSYPEIKIKSNNIISGCLKTLKTLDLKKKKILKAFNEMFSKKENVSLFLQILNVLLNLEKSKSKVQYKCFFSQ